MDEKHIGFCFCFPVKLDFRISRKRRKYATSENAGVVVADIVAVHIVCVYGFTFAFLKHLWDIWTPVSSEKTETSHLAAFVGVVVILSIWLTGGAISATVLMYFTRARFQAPRELYMLVLAACDRYGGTVGACGTSGSSHTGGCHAGCADFA
ncbi:hypothetical protein E1944_21250 [Salmonella enterica subsp. enterica serovar Ahuza]|nr:hypothetical protein [Salmonella enterica subsp. enterica serovar Ahuza]